MSESLWVLAFILLTGLIFIFAAGGIRWMAKRKLEVCTAETTGRVIRWLQEEVYDDFNSATSYMWFPVYAYDVQGKHYEKKGDIGLSEPGKTNEDIVLHYEPGNPYNSYATLRNYDILVYIFRILGGLLTMGALAVWWFINAGWTE